MPGRYLLDTNAIIALFGGEAVVQSMVAGATEVFVPSVALGELNYGAHKSARSQANLERIDRFAAASDVLDVDAGTAREYGRAKDRLRQKGRPLPENDIWIAAVALQHGLTLITRDAHFNDIDGLVVQGW